MSDILCVDGVFESVNGKKIFILKRCGGIRNFLMLLPFFLLFVGDFKLPVGVGSITVPLGMVIIVPAVFWSFIVGRIYLSAAQLLLVGVLLFGFFGALVTPEAGFSRSLVGSLPIVFSVLALIFYGINYLPSEDVVRYMLAGGVVMAVAVIILFLVSLGVSGDYYEQKLVIETPLGRSNYLAAFLIFLFALSVSRSIFVSLIFLVAIFCTLSRGGVLALGLFFMIIPLLRRGWLLFFCVVVVFFGCLIFFLAACGGTGYFLGIFNLQDSGLDSVLNRFELWSFGFDIFSDNTVFGIGPNTFRSFVELNGEIEDVWGVHNSILLLLLNYGVFGFIFYSAYIFVVYRSIVFAEKVDKRFFYLRAVFLVLMVFGFYEPLVGSSAFELLLVLTFVLSRSRVNEKFS